MPPTGGPWPAATLANSRRYAARLWLYCNGCHRNYLVMHDEFVAFHALEPETTFPLLNKRLRCVVCGQRKGQCRSETHGSEGQPAYPIVGSPMQGPQPARRIPQAPPEPRRAQWPEFGADDQIEF